MRAPARELEAELHLGLRVDERADDRLLRAEERDDVEGDDLARVAAADNEPPVLRERVEPHLEELTAAVLVHEVDASVVRQAHDLGHEILLRVVDPGVQPELGGARELVVARGVPDHVGAGHVRELNGGRADPASRPS